MSLWGLLTTLIGVFCRFTCVCDGELKITTILIKAYPRGWYIVQQCTIVTLIYIFTATTKHFLHAFW